MAPPTTAAPTASGGGRGDPHLYGAHGDRTDFKGKNHTWYNLLSTSNLSVNVLFEHDTYNWRRKVVKGSWMKEVAVTAQSDKRLVKVAYHVDQASRAELYVSGVEKFEGHLEEGAPLELGKIVLSLSPKHLLKVTNGEWTLEARNRYIPYAKAKLNAEKKRLDVSVHPIINVDKAPVAPHGLVGQTYDRDGMAVIGALDNYNVKSNTIETKAMGEGGIEGEAANYEIDAKDKFSTAFKYSRFGLTKASPRDVTKLSGAIVVPSAGLGASNIAGAINDEPDTAEEK